jgi:hypothetical protein
MEWMTSPAWDGHLNERIARYNEYLLRREQILRLLSATEELEKDRDSR